MSRMKPVSGTRILNYGGRCSRWLILKSASRGFKSNLQKSLYQLNCKLGVAKLKIWIVKIRRTDRQNRPEFVVSHAVCGVASPAGAPPTARLTPEPRQIFHKQEVEEIV